MIKDYIITAVESPKLSKENDKRYVIVNAYTGKILEDAQGHGFKSIPKAYSYFYNKHDKANDDTEKRKIHLAVREWCMDHEGFADFVEGLVDEDGKLDKESLDLAFKNSGYYDLPFTLDEFIKYWDKPYKYLKAFKPEVALMDKEE
jgi:hypothetical protein